MYDNKLTAIKKMYKMTMRLQSAYEEVTYGKKDRCQRSGSKNKDHLETSFKKRLAALAASAIPAGDGICFQLCRLPRSENGVYGLQACKGL